MTRRVVILVLAGVVGAALHQALTARNDNSPVRVSVASGSLNLQQPIARLDLEGVPLKAALDTLADMCHASLSVNWRDSEVDNKRLVTAHLKNVSLDEALRAILERDAPAHLFYGVREDVILVSTIDRYTSRDAETDVYDVRDLLEDYVKYDLHPSLLLKDDVGGAGDPEDIHVAILAFVQALEARINQLHFSQQVDELAGRLIITADPETHEQVRDFLRGLRQAAKKPGGFAKMLSNPN